METWFAWCEKLVRDKIVLFILLASLLGSFWGVWGSVVKEVERPSRRQEDYPQKQLTLTWAIFLEIKWFVLSLLFWNTLFAIGFSLIISLLFYLLNQFYESVWVKLIVALSVSRAIARKQGKISLFNAYLGGFDLESIPFLGQFVESLTESYENWHKMKFDELDQRCNKMLSQLCEDQLGKEGKIAANRQKRDELLFQRINIEELENKITQIVEYLPDDQGQSTHYRRQLEKIQQLPERDRKNRLTALAEILCPELIEIPDTQN
jgi:hypothetical protein